MEPTRSEFMVRLWAFLKLKNLLQTPHQSSSVNKIEMKSSSGRRSEDFEELTNENIAFQFALRYHFVTNLTSLVITTDTIKPEHIIEHAFEDPSFTSVPDPEKIISKMLR